MKSHLDECKLGMLMTARLCLTLEQKQEPTGSWCFSCPSTVGLMNVLEHLGQWGQGYSSLNVSQYCTLPYGAWKHLKSFRSFQVVDSVPPGDRKRWFSIDEHVSSIRTWAFYCLASFDMVRKSFGFILQFTPYFSLENYQCVTSVKSPCGGETPLFFEWGD